MKTFVRNLKHVLVGGSKYSNLNIEERFKNKSDVFIRLIGNQDDFDSSIQLCCLGPKFMGIQILYSDYLRISYSIAACLGSEYFNKMNLNDKTLEQELYENCKLFNFIMEHDFQSLLQQLIYNHLEII